MINVQFIRRDGNYTHTPIEREMTPGHALAHLVQFEFGFGGVAVEVTLTRVVITTPVLGKTDTATFTGSEADMAPLIMACGMMSDLRRSENGQLTAVESLRILANTDGNFRPFDVVHFGPLIANGGFIKPVALAAAGIEPTVELCNNSTDDVMAAIELAMDAGWNGLVYDLLAA